MMNMVSATASVNISKKSINHVFGGCQSSYRKQTMTNIRKIAKLTGYSVSSVSRVINNHPHVSEEARQKILQVMEELDYRPNILAQELSSGSTRRVGVVIPNTTLHPYFSQLLNGLLDAAMDHNYTLLILPSRYDIDLEKYYLEQLRGRAFDSLIFTSRSVDLETIASYAKYGNIVCCEEVQDPNLSSVYVSRTHACKTAFNWIKDQGKSRIALLFTRKDLKSSTYRLTMEAYKEVFGGKKEPLILDGISTGEDAYEQGDSLLEQDLDCIFSNGDDVATGVVRYYQEKNLKLPLLIGQEKQLTGEVLGIPTIDNKSYQLGQESFKQALSDEKRTIILQSEFIIR